MDYNTLNRIVLLAGLAGCGVQGLRGLSKAELVRQAGLHAMVLTVPQREQWIAYMVKHQEVVNTGRKKRGFAAMDPEQRTAMAVKGGEASQRLGVAHRFTKEEARAAGIKGAAARKLRAELS